MLPLLAPGCQGTEVHPTGSHGMLCLLFLCDLRIILGALGNVFGSATGNRTRVLRLRISRPNPWTIAPHICGRQPLPATPFTLTKIRAAAKSTKGEITGRKALKC